MTRAEQLADLVADARYDRLAPEVVHQLKIRILDTLGCAVGALDAPLMRALRAHLEALGEGGSCTLVGGGCAAPDRAAFFNGALVRYLDFNDSYMGAGDYAHPSDNFGAVLAAAEFARQDGRALLLALAVAYQVQLQLVDAAPVLGRGFDHTVQGAYALACGVAKALGLDAARTAHAIGMCGTSFNSLRVTRTGTLSNWKGLAYANTAFGCTHAALLAMHGVTGPIEVFEGNKGFIQTISGPFEIDWGLQQVDAVLRTSIKKYNATIDAQSSVEAMLELASRHAIAPDRVERIDVDIFKLAFDVIGGGEEGDKYVVRTKEQADHSLRYMLACALIDRRMTPAQYDAGRILRPDVQSLLKRVHIRPSTAFTKAFPRACPVRVTVTMRDGAAFTIEKPAYQGYFTQPFRWPDVVDKFTTLTAGVLPSDRQARIITTVADLEDRRVADLTALL